MLQQTQILRISRFTLIRNQHDYCLSLQTADTLRFSQYTLTLVCSNVPTHTMHWQPFLFLKKIIILTIIIIHHSPLSVQTPSGVIMKTIEVCLHKEGNSFGFVMRGGWMWLFFFFIYKAFCKEKKTIDSCFLHWSIWSFLCDVGFRWLSWRLAQVPSSSGYLRQTRRPCRQVRTCVDECFQKEHGPKVWDLFPI